MEAFLDSTAISSKRTSVTQTEVPGLGYITFASAVLECWRIDFFIDVGHDVVINSACIHVLWVENVDDIIFSTVTRGDAVAFFIFQ